MADKIDLIATRSMTYNTRRLMADDLFDARPRDARLLIAIGKARRVDGPVEASAPKVEPKAPAKPKTSRKLRATKAGA